MTKTPYNCAQLWIKFIKVNESKKLRKVNGQFVWKIYHFCVNVVIFGGQLSLQDGLCTTGWFFYWFRPKSSKCQPVSKF